MKFGKTLKLTSILWWSGQILPPLAILLLIYWPMDFGSSSILWLAAMCAAAGSAISLILRIAYGLFDWKGWSPLIPPPRPLLTIAVVVVVFQAASWSYAEAKKFAARAAADIQKQCDVQRRCPDTVAGWREPFGPPGTMTKAGRWSKYWIRYQVADDHRSFNVWLGKDIDEGTGYAGGVGKQLTITNDSD